MRIGAAACLDSLPVVTTHTLAGPAQFGFRAGRRDVMTRKATSLLHDVSWYGECPVTQSNVSMMIIWP
ncbi:hypothetical protein X751_30785 [Mesorhizobium sp. LNJC395A00]|nr:hypothetical protein X751_30785 [Mesorhizobium sp. LNJC395A00]